ncbi:hypothetical protein HDU96_000201 [Phlyctochytrium bullatum]|nr:hypothetical protein HDU96_000201 [Phlyctochytrium bullatum]
MIKEAMQWAYGQLFGASSKRSGDLQDSEYTKLDLLRPFKRLRASDSSEFVNNACGYAPTKQMELTTGADGGNPSSSASPPPPSVRPLRAPAAEVVVEAGSTLPMPVTQDADGFMIDVEGNSAPRALQLLPHVPPAVDEAMDILAAEGSCGGFVPVSKTGVNADNDIPSRVPSPPVHLPEDDEAMTVEAPAPPPVVPHVPAAEPVLRRSREAVVSIGSAMPVSEMPVDFKDGMPSGLQMPGQASVDGDEAMDDALGTDGSDGLAPMPASANLPTEMEATPAVAMAIVEAEDVAGEVDLFKVSSDVPATMPVDTVMADEPQAIPRVASEGRQMTQGVHAGETASTIMNLAFPTLTQKIVPSATDGIQVAPSTVTSTTTTDSSIAKELRPAPSGQDSLGKITEIIYDDEPKDLQDDDAVAFDGPEYRRARIATRYAIRNATALDDFIIEAVVGYGHHGVVLSARPKTRNLPGRVAIKIRYKPAGAPSSGQLMGDTCTREEKYLQYVTRCLNSNFIEKYLLSWQDESYSYLVTEYVGDPPGVSSPYAPLRFTNQRCSGRQEFITFHGAGANALTWHFAVISRQVRLSFPPVPLVRGICAQIAEALASLHRIGIIHGAVNPKFILVSTVDVGTAKRLDTLSEPMDDKAKGELAAELSPRAKLCNFSRGRDTQRGGTWTDSYGVQPYYAPEIYENLNGRGKGRLSMTDAFKAEVFAFGMCLYALLHSPYNLPPPAQFVLKAHDESHDVVPIARWQERMGIDPVSCQYPVRFIRHDLDPLGRELLKALLCTDPERRPSMTDVANHPWFRNVLEAAERRELCDDDVWGEPKTRPASPARGSGFVWNGMGSGTLDSATALDAVDASNRLGQISDRAVFNDIETMQIDEPEPVASGSRTHTTAGTGGADQETQEPTRSASMAEIHACNDVSMVDPTSFADTVRLQKGRAMADAAGSSSALLASTANEAPARNDMMLDPTSIAARIKNQTKKTMPNAPGSTLAAKTPASSEGKNTAASAGSSGAISTRRKSSRLAAASKAAATLPGPSRATPSTASSTKRATKEPVTRKKAAASTATTAKQAKSVASPSTASSSSRGLAAERISGSGDIKPTELSAKKARASGPASQPVQNGARPDPTALQGPGSEVRAGATAKTGSKGASVKRPNVPPLTMVTRSKAAQQPQRAEARTTQPGACASKSTKTLAAVALSSASQGGPSRRKVSGAGAALTAPYGIIGTRRTTRSAAAAAHGTGAPAAQAGEASSIGQGPSTSAAPAMPTTLANAMPPAATTATPAGPLAPQQPAVPPGGAAPNSNARSRIPVPVRRSPGGTGSSSAGGNGSASANSGQGL